MNIFKNLETLAGSSPTYPNGKMPKPLMSPRFHKAAMRYHEEMNAYHINRAERFPEGSERREHHYKQAGIHFTTYLHHRNRLKHPDEPGSGLKAR